MLQLLYKVRKYSEWIEKKKNYRATKRKIMKNFDQETMAIEHPVEMIFASLFFIYFS